VSPAKRSLFWVASLVVGIALLMLLSDILLPFVAGMALAYFLDPVADRLEARGVTRTVATWIVVLSFFIVFVGLLLFLLPKLQGQVVGLARQLPDMLRAVSEGMETLFDRLTEWAELEEVDSAEAAFADFKKWLANWAVGLMSDVWSSGLAFLNLLGLLFVTPVVAWYLLRDWDHMVARIDGWLPRDQAETIREQLHQIDETLAGFVRGQAMVCVILGVGYAVGLQLAGLKYGLLVGLIAGLISFIPYVGSFVGLILSLGLGYHQFGVSLELLILAVIFFVGQAIEGNYLTPKLVGERVKLHAVWVLFALLAGGSLFGFLGMLLAVPVAAVIGVLVRFALDHYLASPLFLGQGGGKADS
jgi:predicted PurR-regulated permease PerM